MNLSYLRDSSFERAYGTMKLRRPQREALETFHKAFKTIPKKLSACTHEEINLKFREAYPAWHFEGSCPEITFHLATGVGKTRLIGALMAYLFLAQESDHFVIITPRSEIIRKFLKECRPSDPKYIFFDPLLVEEPEIIDAETAPFFEPKGSPLFSGPTIWVLTPQALTAPNSKLKRKSDHASLSPVDYLRSLPDLVIFFDESHHLGPKEAAESSAWRKEIRNLGSKFIFGTTASIGTAEDHNIIYSYDLKKCINEHLYTKMVRVITEQKDPVMDDVDHDRMVLRYGLERLKIKQEALADHARIKGLGKGSKAVMLVCCEKKNHAEEVSAYLQTLPDLCASILLVHSGLGPSKYVEDLLKLEQEDNPKRIVVNVSMLTEGWDVSNVYVIVPLRAMASSILVTQVMGRGLRLPYGEQTGNVEVDTLDVLCFGRETMQEICDRIIGQGFGLEDTGFSVKAAPKGEKKFEEIYVPPKAYTLVRRMPIDRIQIPGIRMKHDVMDLQLVAIPGLKGSELRTFKIHDPQTVELLKGRPGFARKDIVNMVSTGLLKRCGYLSSQIHEQQIRALIDRFLIASGYSGDEVPLEPEAVVHHIKNQLDDLHRGILPQYEKTGADISISLDSIMINVPGDFSSPLDSATVSRKSWKHDIHKGIPMGRWRKCVFEAVPFDQPNELAIAKVIDRSPAIKWWFRNLPKILSLPTPAGQYAPDFAMMLEADGETILLEIKGEVFAAGEMAEANIKKEAAKKWCEAMTSASGKKWTYWFLLDRDASRCEDFSAIKRYGQEPDDPAS